MYIELAPGQRRNISARSLREKNFSSTYEPSGFCCQLRPYLTTHNLNRVAHFSRHERRHSLRHAEERTGDIDPGLEVRLNPVGPAAATKAVRIGLRLDPFEEVLMSATLGGPLSCPWAATPSLRHDTQLPPLELTSISEAPILPSAMLAQHNSRMRRQNSLLPCELVHELDLRLQTSQVSVPDLEVVV